MDQFKLKSEYRPSGDQPAAIEALAEGLNDGLSEQTLLGVTGSGKTFSMANIIEKQIILHIDESKILTELQSLLLAKMGQ